MRILSRQHAVGAATARRFGVVAAIVLLCGACRELATTATPAVRVLQIQGALPVRLLVGEGRRLTALGLDADGNAVQAAVRWSSNDPAIATIDIGGTVRATGVGDVLVSARLGNLVATAQIVTRPAALELVMPDMTNAEVDELYDATAVFLRVDGGHVGVPWDVNWKVTAGAELARLEFHEPVVDRRVRIRMLGIGTVRIEASSNDMVATRTWQVRPRSDKPLLEIVRFTMHQGVAAIGMLFWPDLVVRALLDDVVVTRVEFRNTTPEQTACGSARLNPAGTTPLFDFQPYNFAWIGTPVAAGTSVQVRLSVSRAGRSREVTATGRVQSSDPRNILDYGTDGFPWSPC